MTDHLIVVAIGPVQGYISQARRTQDLWLGSRMLSYLAGVGVGAAQQYGELIYPAVTLPTASSDELPPIPNRFVFQCSSNPVIASLAVEKAIRDAWQKVAENTRLFFDRRFNGAEQWGDIWKNQVDDWLEIYWTASEVTGNYKHDIGNANRAMAARKMLRDFTPSPEDGHKCSLTGEHEALHNGSRKIKAVRTYWASIKSKQANLALLREGERLCALSVIKRLAHEPEANNPQLQIEHRFPSTSSIACSVFRAEVIENWASLENTVRTFIEALRRLVGDDDLLFFRRRGENKPEYFPYIQARIESQGLSNNEVVEQFMSLDGDFFYEDTFEQKAILEFMLNRAPDLQRLKAARTALNDLIRATRALNLCPPHTYLAIISMDGDKMGEVVKGFESRHEHRDFSAALANFAQNVVRPIVEKDFAGRLIYSGGDDVLALVPVRHALEVAERLRKVFSGFMEQRGFYGMHASTGIAFIHHTQPLQGAIKAAHNAQERAKAGYGRNAVVVDVIRRSGERQQAGMPWEMTYQDGKVSIIQVVTHLAQAFSADALSRSLPYDLEQMAYALTAENARRAEALSGGREAELKRLMQRREKQKSAGADIERLTGWLFALGEAAVPALHKMSNEQRWRDVIAWVKLARFLSQACVEGLEE